MQALFQCYGLHMTLRTEKHCLLAPCRYYHDVVGLAAEEMAPISVVEQAQLLTPVCLVPPCLAQGVRHGFWANSTLGLVVAHQHIGWSQRQPK